jgi:hypothetical protein
MINEDEKKREVAKKSKKPPIKKKSPPKKTVGWQYNSKTGRYEPTLAKSKRHNF